MKKKYFIFGLLGLATAATAVTLTTAAIVNKTHETAAEEKEAADENTWVDSAKDDENGEIAIKLLGDEITTTTTTTTTTDTQNTVNLTADKLLVQVSTADDNGYRSIRYIGGLTSKAVSASFTRKVTKADGTTFMSEKEIEITTAYAGLYIDSTTTKTAEDLFGEGYKYIVVYTLEGVPADCSDYEIDVTLNVKQTTKDDEGTVISTNNDSGARNANICGVLQDEYNSIYTFSETESNSGKYSISAKDIAKTSYDIPEYYYTFTDTKNLVGVKAGTITTIVASAFANCTAATSITVPTSVTSIGLGAFEGCSALTSITLPFVGGGTADTGILGYVFGAKAYLKNSKFVPATLAKVTIEEGCTSIESNAFNSCFYITNVVLPSTVTSIGSGAFQSSGLTEIDLSKVTTIGESAFSGSDLTSITIPSSVTSIGEQSFYGCSGLTTINYDGTMAQWNAISISDSALPNNVTSVVCSDGTITL